MNTLSLAQVLMFQFRNCFRFLRVLLQAVGVAPWSATKPELIIPLLLPSALCAAVVPLLQTSNLYVANKRKNELIPLSLSPCTCRVEIYLS